MCWICVLVAVTNEILKRESSKMYSRSAKDGEKGDPNRNPWLAKMSSPLQQIIVHIKKCQNSKSKIENCIDVLICEPQLNSCPDTLTIELGVGISTHSMCYSRGQNLVIITFYQ
jgi:hypothetical protein